MKTGSLNRANRVNINHNSVYWRKTPKARTWWGKGCEHRAYETLGCSSGELKQMAACDNGGPQEQVTLIFKMEGTSGSSCKISSFS